MKKKVLFLLIAFAFIFVGTSSVNAATTLTQANFDAALANTGVETNKITCNEHKCILADDEEYILSGSISLNKVIRVNNNVTITLDNATIDARFEAQPSIDDQVIFINGTGTFKKQVDSFAGGIRIAGSIIFDDEVIINPILHDAPSKIENGTFNKAVKVYFADFTIENGTFNQELQLFQGSAVEIKNGTFKCENSGVTQALIYVTGTSVLVINGGTFEYLATDEGASVLTADDNAEVTINGGTFVSNSDVVISSSDNVDLEIRKGTFTGAKVAASIEAGTARLSGGTFKTTGTGANTATIVTDGNFADLLDTNYMYTANTDYTVDSNSIKWLNAREISVIHTPYDFLEGENQTYDLDTNGTLSFRIDANYSNFSTGGKVYVDNVETSEFTSASGSTIITLNNSLLSTLGVGNHTLKVVFNNGGVATTTFTLTGTPNTNTTTTQVSSNPTTADHIVSYVSILGLSLIGLVGVGIYLKKRKFN